MIEDDAHPQGRGTPLRRGWTTGACATAAAKSATGALLGNGFADPVRIALPGGQRPAFALAHEMQGDGFAEAGIIKDAGDDPDVTHGALIIVRVSHGVAGGGVTFAAGDGVGMVTKPGLPTGVGEPAINPVPRRMMMAEVEALCKAAGAGADIALTVSVRNGEKLAQKTWNPRLGIVGGLSILGTTGIVVPYSCSAWIHAIHSGVDVARAMGITHLVGATGNRSERAARKRLGLLTQAHIDMGDFVGGFLKYVRRHPVARVTIAGGFAKISKLAQGALDLHSARAPVDLDYLGRCVARLGGDAYLENKIRTANSAAHALQLAAASGHNLADPVAEDARKAAARIAGPDIRAGILIIDRAGTIVGER